MTARDPVDESCDDLSEALTVDFRADESLVVTSGVDIVSIDRVAELLAAFPTSASNRLFTPAEQSYCATMANPAEHYAARFGAKEAFRKATGGTPVPFRSIEVCRDEGTPKLSLGKRAQDALAAEIGSRGGSMESITTSVSLSHDRKAGTAMAQVVAVATVKAGDTA